MANSKSNIYPVQLQGAELNLNKFDAEIKQYSGFNKNNSPFVGGCLSNLFTKTEENTTGSSDSVYVDDEGNVFTVDSEGLYKNGVKVIVPEGDIFETWEVEELSQFPANTVYLRKYGDDWFYITFEANAARVVYTFHFRDKIYYDGYSRDELAPIKVFFDSEISTDNLDLVIVSKAIYQYETSCAINDRVSAYNFTSENFERYPFIDATVYGVTIRYIDAPPCVVNIGEKTHIYFNSPYGGELQTNHYSFSNYQTWGESSSIGNDSAYDYARLWHITSFS